MQHCQIFDAMCTMYSYILYKFTIKFKRYTHARARKRTRLSLSLLSPLLNSSQYTIYILKGDSVFLGFSPCREFLYMPPEYIDIICSRRDKHFYVRSIRTEFLHEISLSWRIYSQAINDLFWNLTHFFSVSTFLIIITERFLLFLLSFLICSRHILSLTDVIP